MRSFVVNSIISVGSRYDRREGCCSQFRPSPCDRYYYPPSVQYSTVLVVQVQGFIVSITQCYDVIMRLLYCLYKTSRHDSLTDLYDVLVLQLLEQLDLPQGGKVSPFRVLAQLHRDLLDSHDSPRSFLRLQQQACRNNLDMTATKASIKATHRRRTSQG